MVDFTVEVAHTNPLISNESFQYHIDDAPIFFAPLNHRERSNVRIFERVIFCQFMTWLRAQPAVDACTQLVTPIAVFGVDELAMLKIRKSYRGIHQICTNIVKKKKKTRKNKAHPMKKFTEFVKAKQKHVPAHRYQVAHFIFQKLIDKVTNSDIYFLLLRCLKISALS